MLVKLNTVLYFYYKRYYKKNNTKHELEKTRPLTCLLTFMCQSGNEILETKIIHHNPS